MAGKSYDMQFLLNAQLGGGYSSTFTKAQKAIAGMQQEIQGLTKTQADISAFQKQQSAIEATKNKLSVLQQQYDNIQKEIQETGTYSSTLENKLLSKQQQIDKTSASLEQQTQKLDQMDAELQKAGVDTGNLTQESAKLAAKIDDLKTRQEEAADSAASFGEQSVQAVTAVHEALVSAGIVMALKEIAEAYAECVSAAGDFEESLSNVEALSGANAEEMTALSEMAKELGATTKFTAKESADAMGYMAMAGWDAQQMLQGMPGVLQLAAASGEDLATVADIVTDSMTAFGLTAGDAAHYADVLAATATNANTNVSVMGETFKYAAPVAGALGYSIEDVSVAIGLMANAGVKGSNAGTALRNVFNGLLEGVTLTGAAFGEAEVSAVNADGTMTDFAGTIDELRGYFEQMTEAERVNNAIAIAGQRGYSGLLSILNATDADYAKLTASIENCTGAAEKMAAVKLDNMNGQLTLLNSAAEALKITVGEQFTPVMKNLAALGAGVLTDINRFLAANPGLIKAVTAFVGIIGAATAALTAYAAIAKIIKALDMVSLFSGPASLIMVGAGALATLTAGIVAFNGATDDAVPSVKELTEAAQEMNRAIEESGSAYDSTVADAEAAANIADRYIGKLEAMGDYAGLNAEEQRDYHNTLVLLCDTIPELADCIDLETNTIIGGTEALRKSTEAWKENTIAQATTDRLTSVYEKYADVLLEAEKNALLLSRAEGTVTASEARLTEVRARMAELSEEATQRAAELTQETGIYKDYTELLKEAGSELAAEYQALTQEQYDLLYAMEDANEDAIIYQKAINADADAVAAAKDEIALYEEAVGNLANTQEESVQTNEKYFDAINNTVDSVTTRIEALSQAYQEAYDAAYSSISGQYDLWDAAEKVIATSVGNINTNLESQAQYWSDYNTNLQSLSARTRDIEGLSDVIASFADGSTESVNAIAGMATASDADLKKMVENWKAVQTEQDAAAKSIAELATDYTSQMNDLQYELESVIYAMDFSDEAADKAKATIQGFINGATDMIPEVQAAYKTVARAAMDAIDAQLDIHSPSRVMMEKAQMTWAGYINQTEAMTPEVQAAMAETADAGVDAAEAQTVQMMMFSPELMAALTAREAVPVNAAVAESSAAAAPTPIAITFQIDGNASPETIDRLEEFVYSEEFNERVRDVVREAGVDVARGDYQ